MYINEFVWNQETIEHILRHNVLPEEVEEMCFNSPHIIKSKQAARGANPVYYAMGKTESGRYLLVVFIYLGKNRALVITARDMDDKERIYYRRVRPND